MLLNCHSYYSFKYGMMSPERLLQEANKLGFRALVLTDINNTSGILDFFRFAPRYNIKPVAGVDFRSGGQQQYIALAKTLDGFKEINDFLSWYLQNEKSLKNHAPKFKEVFVIYPLYNAPPKLRENEYIGIRQSDFNKLPFSPARHLSEKYVVLHPVTFPETDSRVVNGREVAFKPHHIHEAHRLLRAMDANVILTRVDESGLADIHEYMLSEDAIRKKFTDYAAAIRNTEKLMEECSINFEFEKSKNKIYFTGEEETDRELLLDLCEKGMKYRYKEVDQKIHDRYNKEIETITRLKFTAYFLINWDIVRYARERGFFYVGRGSGANSMVAYLFRITDVDPIELDLYFERFINEARKYPPDFDIDFSSNERDEIVKYIFEKHGEEFTALLATYSTLKENAILRELGKVYGLPKKEIDALPELSIPPDETEDIIKKKIYFYGHYLEDFPSHLGVHSGGILISEKPIHYYTATVIPPKGFPLTQFSMLEAEDVGLYKYDILAQRGLGKIKDAVEIIKRNSGEDIDIHNVDRFKQDENIRKNLQTADLMGCFYVESPAMRMLLAKLKASTYLDLVAASSIIRPGVAQSGMMREYILRFHDPSRRIYQNKTMEELLHETFGVMVYQEDVIKVAHCYGKLTLEESDKLRRGMGWKYRERVEFTEVKNAFFENCRKEKYDEKDIAEVWRQMESFGGFAFAKGHSASYAVESYQCMFLKTYYPLEYMVAVINNGGGFYRPEIYVHEAQLKGGIIHAPDINKSDYHTVISEKDIYLGLNLVKDLEKNTAGNILNERAAHGAFADLEDFLQRVTISTEQLSILIRINAFRFTGKSKSRLFWDMYAFVGNKKKNESEAALFKRSKKNYELPAPEQGPYDNVLDELEILDFTIQLPFQLIKNKPGINTVAAQIPAYKGKTISIIGYLVTRKVAQTKNKQVMSFGTFLDSEGRFIDTVHFPDSLQKYPFLGRGCYVITGRVTEEFGFYSIEVSELHRLDFVTRLDEETLKKKDLLLR